jgi:clan AA aspartic protease (TIGR02281 family)
LCEYPEALWVSWNKVEELLEIKIPGESTVKGMQKNKIGMIITSIMMLSACGTTTPAPTPEVSAPPVPVASASSSSAASSTDTAALNASIANDRYQNALNMAAAARAVTETALAKEDWSLVADRWQESISQLKAVPKNSINYPLAMKILPQFQQNLSHAREKAANFKAPKTDQPISDLKKSDPIKKISKADKVTDPQVVVTKIEQTTSFSLPIISKNNDVPIVEVVINGSDRIPMMLDTGASKTLLTKGVAERLKLVSSGKTKAKTANGTAEFDTVKLDSVEFGQGKVTDLSVAVGDDNLNYGLLGHDVYKGYDITLTEDSVQFKKR